MAWFEECAFISRCECETHWRLEGHENPAFDLGRAIHQSFHNRESLNVPFGSHYKLAHCATSG